MLSHNVSLLPYTTFGVNTMAQDFFQASTAQEMINFLTEYKDPYIVLGGGSNILFVCEKVKCVVQMCNTNIMLKEENDEQVLLEVGAGVEWDDLVLFAVDRGYYGLENLSAIPGKVGASPVQNIGAYGVEVSACISSLEYIDRESLQIHVIEAKECDFSYRNSVFKHKLKDKAIITKVLFRLRKNGEIQVAYGTVHQEYLERRIINMEKSCNKSDIQLIRESIISIRASKLPDPKVLGNVGSYFKNPIVSLKQANAIQKLFPLAPIFPCAGEDMRKISAAWLIEQVGMKGYRMARVGVHNKQALVIVNNGGASAGEILALENLIILNVQSKFGVRLEAEVNKY